MWSIEVRIAINILISSVVTLEAIRDYRGGRHTILLMYRNVCIAHGYVDRIKLDNSQGMSREGLSRRS